MAQYNLETLPVEWTSSSTGNFYTNERSYCSISILDREVVDVRTETEYLYNFKIQFLERCLEFFSKEGNPEDLVSRVGILDTFIDPFPNIGQKVIFFVSHATVENLPDREAKDSVEKVIYNIDLYYEKISYVCEKFVTYQKEILKDIFNKKTLGYQGLDFTMESQNLQSFNENLQKLFDINDVDSSKYKAICFKFGDDGHLEGIDLEGSSGLKSLKISFSFFSSQSPQSRSQTLHLIRSLDNLYRACKATSSTYETIIQRNYISAPKILNNPQSPIHRTDKESDSYGISNKDVTNKFASSTEISKRFVKEFQNIARTSLYTTPCMTAEQKMQKDRQLDESRSENISFAKEVERSIGDSFINSLPDILVKVGKEKGKDAMNALGVDVLNRLGICGLGDIIAMVANTATTYLNPEEYTSALTDCALDKIKNKDMEQFVLSLEKFNRGTQILERYRSMVGSPDILPPWKTNNYRSPDSFYDGSFNDSYTLSTGATNDYDIEFLFSAYRDSIRLEIRPENILEALTSTFPDEMGWISFFIDSTEILLSKCAPPQDLAASLGLGVCNSKRFALPEMFSANIGSSGIGSPSQIANQLVEELKNLIISLIVRTITASMGQLMQIVTAGVSFDTNYFKRGDYIPDLFQNENYIYDALCENASNKSRNRESVNAATKQMLIKSTSRNSLPDISPDSLERFLSAVSVSLGEYEKIKLFRGIAGPVTYDKVIYLAAQNDLAPYFENYSDVEQFFLEMGKRLSVSDLEKKYFDKIYNFEPSPTFCLVDDQVLDRAYMQNKAGITQKQVDAMKLKLKEIQKDKICFAANTIGNPNGPILGEVGKVLKDPNNPIYQPLKEKEADYFIEATKGMLEAIASSYKSDLYAPQGVFDVCMSSYDEETTTATGYNDKKFGAIFGISGATSILDYPVFTKNVSWGTYDDFKKEFFVDTPLELSILTKTTQFGSLSDADIDAVVKNFNTNILENVIKKYFQEIDSTLKTGSLDLAHWQTTYNRLNRGRNIANFLGSIEDFQDILRETYTTIEDFEIPPGKMAPLNMLPSKGALLQKYIGLSLLIRVMYTEYIFKSLRIFRNYNLDTMPRKTEFVNFLKNELSANQIKDNMAQILFQLPYQQEYAEDLQKLALELNEGITASLKGSDTNFYNDYKKQIDAAVTIFIDVVLGDYDQQNIDTLFANSIQKQIKSISQIIVGNPPNVQDLNTTPPDSAVQIRAEKYYDVGRPINDTLPSGIVSESSLKSSLESSMIGQKIEKYWPQGWKKGIRLVAFYPYNKTTEPPTAEELAVVATDGTTAMALPVSTYVEEFPQDAVISVSLSSEYNEDQMLDGLTSSPQFKKYFYPSVNMEQILSFCTNYYINEADERIDSMNSEGFFAQTKTMLLEL